MGSMIQALQPDRELVKMGGIFKPPISPVIYENKSLQINGDLKAIKVMTV